MAIISNPISNLGNPLDRLGILGPTISDFIKNPDFGIPILGHATNLPALTLGTLTALDPSTTPADSPAYQQARQEGAIRAWRDRTDINPWLKFGAETGLGFTGPFNSAVVKPLGLGFKGAVGSVKGFQNVHPYLHDLAAKSPEWISPTIKAVENSVPNNIPGVKDIPGIDWLFQPSKEGLIRDYGNVGQHIAQQSRIKGISPEDFIMNLRELGKNPAAARLLDVGEVNHQKFADLIPLIEHYGPKTKQQTAIEFLLQTYKTDPAKFYEKFGELAKNSGRKSIMGNQPREGQFSNTYQQINEGIKSVLLSGMTSWVSNFNDFLPRYSIELGKNPSEILSKRHLVPEELSHIMGGHMIPPEAGIDPMRAAGIERNESILNRISNSQAAGIGAGLGAASAISNEDTRNPSDIIKTALLGAGSGYLTKQGFRHGVGGPAGDTKSLNLMQKVETLGRERFFIEGVKKYLADSVHNNEIFGDIMAAAGDKAAILRDTIQKENYLLNPAEIGGIASELGIPENDVIFISDRWRDLREQAINSGIDLTNKVAYDYSKTNNLTESARKFLPFPVWSLKNPGYYAQTFADKPEIAWPLINYLSVSEQQKQAEGLPSRFAYKMPLMSGLGSAALGGTLYGNPMGILSVAQQIQEPPPHPAGEKVSFLDNITDALGGLGLSLSPTLSFPLQALGLVDRGSDFQTISPWSRLLTASHQAHSGEYLDPEGIFKKIGEDIRGDIAPGAQSDVHYPEYLVRKKIAELSLENTGKPWYENPDYSEAMIDETSPIRHEAARKSGNEQSNIMMARKILPLQLQWLPNKERDIRRSKEQEIKSGHIDETGKPVGDESQINPVALGYRKLSNSDLQLMKNVYEILPENLKESYLNKHPELANKIKKPVNNK